MNRIPILMYWKKWKMLFAYSMNVFCQILSLPVTFRVFSDNLNFSVDTWKDISGLMDQLTRDGSDIRYPVAF